VTLPRQPTRKLAELPFAHGEFNRLTWVGFTSSATSPVSFYLDNFHLECRR
jgi:hypothetical protein